MTLKMCLRLDEKFEKFEHNIAFLGMEMAELYKEYAKMKAEFCNQITTLENEMAKLREQNGILTSRLMMNNAAAEIYEQNLANIQSMAQNSGISSIMRDEENLVRISNCPDSSEKQQQEIAPQQIVEQKPHYTVNPLDELNETSAVGFGQNEEDGLEEEGDEIVAGTSLQMDGIRERMGNAYVYDNNLPPPEEGSSKNGNIKVEFGRQQQHAKKKTKYVYSKKLICQWPGCGLNIKFKADMQRHWRTHTGERPYRCLICGKTFARSDHMKNHELKQHNLI